VEHKQLWAPGRLGYITGQDKPPQTPAERLALRPGADAECFLCRGIADQADRENLVIERTEQSVVVLNRYPYNNGHLLVAPLAHKARPDALDAAELLDVQRTLVRYLGLLEQLLGAEGFNVGLNLGRSAGAGLPGHLHWHVVPRWNGDTNFMAVLAGVDVIPQSLDALWTLLTEANRTTHG
jgi:ATP adenylyltransferase